LWLKTGASNQTRINHNRYRLFAHFQRLSIQS
jgi:hypothetical protein